MIESFLQRYRDALGDAAPLPVVFGYGDEPVAEIRKIPRCMIGAIRRVCEEGALTLCADNVLCGGGSLYTAFAPMQERIPGFVSEVEHYKQTPGQVREYIRRLDIRPTEKPFLNFVRMDRLASLDGMEGGALLCHARHPVGALRLGFLRQRCRRCRLDALCVGLLQHRDLCRRGEPPAGQELLHRTAGPLGPAVGPGRRTQLRHPDAPFPGDGADDGAFGPLP